MPMTVITTLVTARYTVHASDSFLTVKQGDGTRKPVETKRTKIVRVEAWQGAMSYFGWATSPASNTTPEWDTLTWLQDQAQQAGASDSAGAFAIGLARRLETEASRRPSADPLGRGIGIHFSCYERIGDYWIPEMFIISNLEDPSYRSLHPQGVRVTRNLHVGLVGIPETSIVDVDRDARLCAYRLLQAGTDGWWFNGDPIVFGPVASAFRNTIEQLRRRGNLSLSAQKEHADLARMPVELVSGMFQAFSIKNSVVVGGDSHDLVISPTGDYYSTTGD
jgi:hypothetical protein